MRARLLVGFIALGVSSGVAIAQPPRARLPRAAPGWTIELAAEAPRILYPTAIAAAPDGTVFLGQDPMDMPGPPTVAADSVVAIREGKIAVFAEKLWSVMGLEWVDGTLYVVHAPYLSAFRDTDGDGRADDRVDLITGLGPEVPGAGGINDHVAAGIRLGMDGFLYIAVGDKGIPHGRGKDGRTIRLQGGGVIRIRRDGTGLEVVSTGERNPLSVALGPTGEIFTYGNDDDSKKWPNSLTHHIVGGHYGFPYQFLTAPFRCLPIMAGEFGGAGAQGVCYNEDGLPAEYRGNLFFCDWGAQGVVRFEIRKAGGSYAVTRRTVLASRGEVDDFRPFSLAVTADGTGFWLVDWGYSGWQAKGPKTGRLYRLRYEGADRVVPAPRPRGSDRAGRLAALEHPALSARLESQRVLAGQGSDAVPGLVALLDSDRPATGRMHALWTLDAIGSPDARAAIRGRLGDTSPQVRLQACRSLGIRGDRDAWGGIVPLLKDRDPAVRREAAIALGKIGEPVAIEPLMAALGDSDRFAAWSIRQAIRKLGYPTKEAMLAALVDPRRRESALTLADESWCLPVVQALVESLEGTNEPPERGRVMATLAGQYRRYPEWKGAWFGPNPLAGEFPRKTVPWAPEGMQEVIKGLRVGLNDRDSSVRFQTVFALGQVGPEAAPILISALGSEHDVRNQAAIADSLGAMKDVESVRTLTKLAADPARAEPVRAAALDGLTRFRNPDVLRARLAVLYEPKAPDSLIARALPPLARDGVIPPNDVATFLDHPSAPVRSAALLSLNVKKELPPETRERVLARLDDRDQEVREAAIMAAGALGLREAVPRLLQIAAGKEDALKTQAVTALCLIPDPRALQEYRRASGDSDPSLRRSARKAIESLGKRADPGLVRSSGRATRPSMSTDALARYAGARAGDPVRGERLFFENRSIACSRCHQVGGRSDGDATFGPDLAGLASKYGRAEIIRSILHPADRVASGYQPVVLAMSDGRILSGRLTAETGETLELTTPELKRLQVSRSEVRERRTSNESLMPAGLVDTLTPIEFTDLVSYLASLKGRPSARESEAPSAGR
jgi:putative heme-binding domain-containing protein